MSTLKNFDFGIYTFKRKVAPILCPADDQKIKDGEVFAVLHPMNNVDSTGLLCFGVSKSDLYTKTLHKSNLRIQKVVTLKFEKVDGMSTLEETHSRLNQAVQYLALSRAGESLSLALPAPQLAQIGR